MKRKLLSLSQKNLDFLRYRIDITKTEIRTAGELISAADPYAKDPVKDVPKEKYEDRSKPGDGG